MVLSLFRLPLLAVALITVSNAAYSETIAKRMANYTGATFCDREKVEEWTCRFCNDNFALADGKPVRHKDLLGFTGYDSELDSVILAFRGSDNIGNWVRNLNGVKTTYPFTSNRDCKLHKGIYSGYRELMETDGGNLLKEFLEELAKRKTARILVTGHSLGGAMASIAAFDMQRNLNWYPGVSSRKIDVYSFSSPRWANDNMAKLYNYVLQGRTWQISFLQDLVPNLPPKRVFWFKTGYENVGSLIYYKTSDGPFQVCGNSLCSRQADGRKSSDHTMVFGNNINCKGEGEGAAFRVQVEPAETQPEGSSSPSFNYKLWVPLMAGLLVLVIAALGFGWRIRVKRRRANNNGHLEQEQAMAKEEKLEYVKFAQN